MLSLAKPRKGKSYVRDTHPELRTQFVKALNVHNPTFDELSSHSNVRCVWQCPKTNCEAKCLHTWEATVNARTMYSPPSGCPTCSGLVVCPCNSLGAKYPELLKEYSPENTRSPFTLPVASHFVATWTCSNSNCGHHIWNQKVVSRTRLPRPSGCPFCSSRRCCPCDSLQQKFPALAAEFDLEKNFPLTPDQLTPGSNLRAWWFCKVHNFSWNAKVTKRTEYNSPGCRYCKMSKMEFYMNKVLESLLEKQVIIAFEYDKRLGETRLRADFWISLTNGRSLVLEMDGEQHFLPVSFGSTRRSAENQLQDVKQRDLAKRAWCERYHVHLLRISYLVPLEDYERDLMEYFEWCKTAPANLSAISHIHVINTPTSTQMDE